MWLVHRSKNLNHHDTISQVFAAVFPFGVCQQTLSWWSLVIVTKWISYSYEQCKSVLSPHKKKVGFAKTRNSPWFDMTLTLRLTGWLEAVNGTDSWTETLQREPSICLSPPPLRIPFAPHGTAPFLILRAALLHTPGAPAGQSGCSGGSLRPQELRNTCFCSVVNIIKPGENQRATLPVALLFLVS